MCRSKIKTGCGGDLTYIPRPGVGQPNIPRNSPPSLGQVEKSIKEESNWTLSQAGGPVGLLGTIMSRMSAHLWARELSAYVMRKTARALSSSACHRPSSGDPASPKVAKATTREA